MRKTKTFNIKNTERVFLCPTDTIYGLSARVEDKKAIQRILNLKKRENTKFVILIPDISYLDLFKIRPSKNQLFALERLWPGPFSVAFDDEKAFRVPDFPELREFLKEIGPIVSTSANLHKHPPVKSADEAYQIFKDRIDLYIDKGPLKDEASSLIRFLR